MIKKGTDKHINKDSSSPTRYEMQKKPPKNKKQNALKEKSSKEMRNSAIWLKNITHKKRQKV